MRTKHAPLSAQDKRLALVKLGRARKALRERERDRLMASISTDIAHGHGRGGLFSWLANVLYKGGTAKTSEN